MRTRARRVPSPNRFVVGRIGRSLRTEPLIGLQFSKRFLHDGRAGSLVEAIAAHGGDGAAARERFLKLAPADSAALISFLRSL